MVSCHCVTAVMWGRHPGEAKWPVLHLNHRRSVMIHTWAKRCSLLLWTVREALSKHPRLSRYLNTLGHQSVLAFFSNVSPPLPPLLKLCSATSGLIKVSRRTRSSGYTWEHLLGWFLPARPIREPVVFFFWGGAVGKRDSKERGAVHILSNLLMLTVWNRCTNVKVKTVKCLTWHWRV